jgi:hypothetical protein
LRRGPEIDSNLKLPRFGGHPSICVGGVQDEFRRQMVELVRAGPAELAREFQPTAQSIGVAPSARAVAMAA